MPITRAQAETLLIRRVGDLLAQAELDSSTHDGTNEDLADPIAYAVRTLGGTTADPTTPADADLAGITDIDELIDLAELRALETLHAYVLDLVTTTAGPRKEEYSQMAKGLEVKIARRTLHLRYTYGRGAPTLAPSTLTLDFAQHLEANDA